MCVLAAAMLLRNVAQGFYIPDAMADSLPLALAGCGVLLLAFFLGGYNKVTLGMVPVMTGVLAVLAFLLLRNRGVDIVDRPGSETAHYIYWFALVVICVLVYLLSRFRIGVALLFVSGCGVQGLLEFLEYQVSAWVGLVFAGSCIVLLLLRQYRSQALRSSTAQPDFSRFFRWSVLMTLAAALLGCLAYAAVIRPLAPPTMELKLLERYLAFHIVEHTGISSYYAVQNPELFTDLQDETRDDDAAPEDEPPEDLLDPPMETPAVQPEEPGDLAGSTPLSAVSYRVTPGLRVLLVILGVLLALGLPPLIRIWVRRRQMARMAALDPAQQIQALYRFYLKKFQRLGWKKRDGETPFEFAARSGEALGRYLSGTCGLETLTAAFVAARYGTGAPQEDCCAACREIYSRFLENCKAQLGPVRYMLKFYVL